MSLRLVSAEHDGGLFADGSIPMHYHFNMLQDEDRCGSFRDAIDRAVFPRAKVLELGGGTGVLSYFAARRADRVWCVERDPRLAEAARQFLRANPNGHRVEVIEADARDYLPPRPVDVVICEMLHAAMLCERQIEVIESFKRRYKERFGGPLPRFIPEATILAVQPVEQNFRFHGYEAAVPMFQVACPEHERTKQLAEPALYKTFFYDEALPCRIACEQTFVIAERGRLNALRFATKNLLMMLVGEGRSIDWSNQHLVLPLALPLDVAENDAIRVRFSYAPGDSIPQLQSSLHVDRVEHRETVTDRRFPISRHRAA